jgi:aminoglycoside 6'-N-acetyltransferase I
MKVIKIAPEDGNEWIRMRDILWPGTLEEHQQEIDQYFTDMETDVVGVFVLARDNQKLGGFIEVGIRNYAEGSSSTRVPYIEGWYVDVDLRGNKYGKQLMDAAESWALEKGFRELASDAELDNFQSIAIHKTLGFKETGRLVCF